MRRLQIFISHPSHYLTDCEPHGDGLLAQEYIRRLGERGHEVHVAVPVMKIERPFAPTVHLHRVPSWTHVSTSRPSAQHRLEYAIRVRGLLRRLQKTISFDLIHQLNPVVLGMSSLLGHLGLPIVLGPLPAPGALPLPDSTGRKLNRAVLHREIRHAAMILVPSAASLPLIPEDDESRSKVRELHFGIDTQRFSPGSGETDDHGRNVLFLANLDERKGPLVLLDAFERIASEFPDVNLRIAGGGHTEAVLRERAETSAYRSRIEMLGRIPREGVRDLLRSATVYCLPSTYEAFGMTALEAMACGKPVIGTQVGGLGLLVGETSPRVSPGSVEDLAKALRELLSSETLRASTGRANRRIAVEQYDWDGVIDRLEELYAEVIERHRTAAQAG